MSDPATPPQSPSPATPNPVPYAAPASASAQVAGPASILLKVSAGVAIFLALMSLIEAVLPRGGWIAAAIGGLASCIGLIGTLVMIAALVVYLIWQYRAYAQVRAAGASTTYTPGWSVGWWIIPFANFVFSRPILVDLWAASGATASPGPTSSVEQSAGGRPRFVWLCFVGFFALLLLGIVLGIIGIWSGIIGRLSNVVMAAMYVVWGAFFFGLALFSEDVQRTFGIATPATPAVPPAAPPAPSATTPS